MNRVITEHPTISVISELFGFIIYSDSDIAEIEKCTRGQSGNPMWMKYRKGIMTALSFHRISKLKVSADPDKLIRLLMEGSSFVIVPAPLLWGRKKEIKARKCLFKTHKAEHGHLDLVEQGLIIDQSCFYLGASPDGLCNCKKCGQFLIEIKCHIQNVTFHRSTLQKIIAMKINIRIYSLIQNQLGITKFKVSLVLPNSR